MRYQYDFVPTPFGDALAVFSPTGLVAFDLSTAEEEAMPWVFEDVRAALRAPLEEAPGIADETAALVAEYFAGAPIDFHSALRFDWSLTHGFTTAALQAIAEIPYGETMSYGDVAVRAGRPRAARAVGTACRLTPFSIVLPVHRVVRADGTPGEYGGFPERKRYLLDLEQR